MTLPDMTEQQINIILTALGQRPYIEVADLLNSIANHLQGQKLSTPAANGVEITQSN